jgi:hypothetical protein
MESNDFNSRNIGQNTSPSVLFNSPTALALMAQLMPHNTIQPQVNSPVFNNLSSPSSSSTSSTPLPIPNMQLNGGLDSNHALCAICHDKATGN